MYRLTNATQSYDWGSTAAIPSFLGRSDKGTPVAELWMGTHHGAPSRVEAAIGLTVPLAEVSGELPYLMKVLAADRPLSLQVHPGRESAKIGFLAEEAAGIPLNAPSRVYKDPNHKPELVYALTTFESLVGFRPTAEILRVLAAVDAPLAKELGESLRARPGFRGIVSLVERLLTDVPAVGEIEAVVNACRTLTGSGMDIKRAYLTAIEIARFFPTDVGVVISLFLNRLTLQPGEAAFLGDGVIHAHLSGMCVEVMASSDNVLRAGLTTKHVDPEGLVRCLKKGMSRVARVIPEQWGFSTDIFSTGIDDFALSVTQCSSAEPGGIQLPDQGRRIVLCTGGEATLLNASGQGIDLKRGDSVYAAPEDGVLRVFGLGEVVQVYRPIGRASQSTMIDLV